jgi:hypothetical protein
MVLVGIFIGGLKIYNRLSDVLGFAPPPPGTGDPDNAILN